MRRSGTLRRLLGAWLPRLGWMAMGAAVAWFGMAVHVAPARVIPTHTCVATPERESVPVVAAQNRLPISTAVVPPRPSAVDPPPVPQPEPLLAPKVPEHEGPALPRLPGTTERAREARYEVEQRAWLWVVTLRVPASLPLVVDFYQQALRDAGMTTWTEDQEQAQSKHVAILKGRARRRDAQVSMEQSRAEVRTDVRILWRWWLPDAASP